MFATDSRTHSFRRAHTDYAAGVAYVDVQVGDGTGPDVFGGRSFSQHLSVYDGVMTAAGEGVTARVIVCGLRNLSPDVSLGLARLAVEYRGRGVVGFDLAGGEAGNPASDHRAAFDHARGHDVAVTCHAGEGAGAACHRGQWIW